MPQADLLTELNLDASLLEIIEAAPLPSLLPKRASNGTSQAVGHWLTEQPDFPASCAAGLCLLADELDRSHEISQADATADGSFWHGIMHRREGDFWNSGYWMRKVGRHAVIDQLADMYPTYGSPFQFIADCQSATNGASGNRTSADRDGDPAELLIVQWAEWQLLFAHCLGRQWA